MKAQRLMLQILLAAAVAAGFATSATAAMYKWTDKDGNVQYTQTPPPEGNVTEIAPPPHVAPPAAAESGNTGKEETAKDKKATAEPPLTPEQLETYQRNCEAARGNLETYRTARRVQQADGEVVVMDDEKRQQKIQQTEEQIKKFCR